MTPEPTVNLLEVLWGVIATGLMDCNNGIGRKVRSKGASCVDTPGVNGKLMLPMPENADDGVAEIDWLFTGGRMSKETKALVKKAYKSGGAKFAQAVAMMSAEFNTLASIHSLGRRELKEPEPPVQVVQEEP